MFIVSALLHEDDLHLLVNERGGLSDEFERLAYHDERESCQSPMAWLETLADIRHDKWWVAGVDEVDGTPYRRVDLVASDKVDLDELVDNDAIGWLLAAASHPYIAEIRHWQASGRITAEDTSESLLCDQRGAPLSPVDSVLFRRPEHVRYGFCPIPKDATFDADDIALLLEEGYEVRVEPSRTPADELAEMAKARCLA